MMPTASLRASAPGLLETTIGAHPFFVTEESGKRQRPSSTHSLPSPSPRKRQLVEHTSIDAVVSETLLEKKPKQRRWMNRKAPPRKWTAEEDAALSAAVKQHGAKNWKHIAEYVPNRNHTQCLQRWGKVLAPDLVKGHWTTEEDRNLVDFVRELASEGMVKNWGEVANQIPGRTSKQCRERWFNHLDPSIKRGNYTEQEDTLILTEQARLGNRWSIISAMLPGRTEDAVKIRWKTLNREMKNAANPNKNSTPKKPRKDKKPKTPSKEDASLMNSPFGSPPPFPISESVKLMMAGNGLKVQTALPDLMDPWSRQVQTISNNSQPATNGHSQPPAHPSSWSHNLSKVKTEHQHIGPHRYRAESLEWLEDALLSPVPKGPTPKSERGGYSLAKSLTMHERPRQEDASNYDKQAVGVLRHASELLGLSQHSGQPLQPLQMHQLTPPQTCHQAAHKMSIPCINPPNLNLKDEDLDHFLTDMDLENLGGALEHRLSFG